MSEKAHTIDTLADAIAAFSGTSRFLLINVTVFVAWIVLNTLTPWRFDPYPFVLMITLVSIEAIVLSIFVLMSQNRQAASDRAMAKQDAQTNRAAKEEIEAVLQRLDQQDQMLLEQAANILSMMRHLSEQHSTPSERMRENYRRLIVEKAGDA